jgi:hypothetical protein
LYGLGMILGAGIYVPAGAAIHTATASRDAGLSAVAEFSKYRWGFVWLLVCFFPASN